MAALKNKSVLVAGGTGLVGVNLVKKAYSMGANVTGTFFSREPHALREVYTRCDFTKFDECLAATKEKDYVILCAAQSFGAKVMKENPSALILPNLNISIGLLEACRRNGVERVVVISSSTVYQEAYHPIGEDELDLNALPYSLYEGVGGLNRYVEQAARFYARNYNMKIGIVRAANIFGPFDKFDTEKSNVLPGLIMRAVRKEDPFIVWGNGHVVRDFIYVDDFIEAVLQILESYCIGDPVNIGSGEGITVREAVRTILEVCDHPVVPLFDSGKPSAIPYRVLNTNKFRSLFGEGKSTSFKEGIERTVEWYVKKKDKKG
jgi:nucleoside-diphosphate-sugar epimerase